jgi:predicted DNA-binding transcriptional regulator AlpA
MNARKSVTLGRPDPLATPEEVAAVLGVAKKTLDQWRSDGKGPDYLKVGKFARYRWPVVNAWLETREITAGGIAT